MRFEKWEEEAFNYLTKLYDNFFEELSLKLKTKQQYAKSNPISSQGVYKRLKSTKSPQTYKLCSIVLIEDDVVVDVIDPKLVLKKHVKHF